MNIQSIDHLYLFTSCGDTGDVESTSSSSAEDHSEDGDIHAPIPAFSCVIIANGQTSLSYSNCTVNPKYIAIIRIH